MNQNYLKEIKRFGLVEVELCSSLDIAREAATNLAANTFAQVCPVTLFMQGERLSASTAIPAGMAIKIFGTDPVQAKASLEQVKKSYNRPIDKDHVKAVSQYLIDAIENNEKYILPSLTVTATKKQKIFTIEPKGESFIQLGYIVLNLDDTSLTVTDGQHRLEGIRLALQHLNGPNLDKLKADGISIMFSFEDDINQVHQDFADCAKTKALPKSMIAVYDRRLPVNGLILDAIELCPLFNEGKTDSTSNSLSKKSSSLLLTNSLRNLMKSLFTGNHSMADAAFEAYVNRNMSTRVAFEKHKNIFISTINALTDYSPVLKQISVLEIGPKRQKIVDYRDKYLIANPAGLSLACKAVYQFTLCYPNQDPLNFIRRLMTEIDWLKDAPIWQGNVVVSRGDKRSISSLNKPFSMAIDAIAKELNIILDPQETLI